MKIEDFADKTPEFLPEDFFSGGLEGWLVLESVTGGLQKRGTIAAKGRWLESERTVHFTETWTLDDGHVDTLEWKIKKLKKGSYSGSETNIVGEAQGEQAGCAFHWTYTRETPQSDGSKTKLNFDDWFYLIERKVAIVRGSAGRLGLPFATAHVTYRKLT